jgi:outer membrane beta-barrel protein
MRLHDIALPLGLALAGMLPLAAQAQSEKPANEQVIVPQVERREVKLPKFPSNDFEIGLFAGTYSVQNFGAATVKGVRLGYHVTEDVFVEGVYGQTKASDELFRQLLPGGGIFPTREAKLNYYNVSAGFNVLPGEVFLGKSRAFASSIYLIAGVGSTKIEDQRKQTLNFGLGTRVLFADWLALQVDLRDHVFSLDLLGKRTNTKNLELTGGLTIYF